MNRRIGYIALVVRDYDEALAFYVDKLGFVLIEDTYIAAQDKRWVLVGPSAAGGPLLLLARASNDQQRAFIGSALGVAGADGERAGSGAGSAGRIRSAWQQARENPQLLIYKLQTNAYKFAWLLIPISVPFVALTFLWRREFGLYDHTIFATYSITFLFALAGLATFVSYFWSSTVAGLLLLYAPVHMYWQLRGTYGLRRFSAFWRMLALSAFAWMAVGIFAAILAALSE